MTNGARVGWADGLVEDVEDERNYNQHQLTPVNVFTKSHDSGHCIVRCHVTGSSEIKSTGRLIGTCLPGRRDKRLSGRHARANRVDNALTFMCVNPSPHTLTSLLYPTLRLFHPSVTRCLWLTRYLLNLSFLFSLELYCHLTSFSSNSMAFSCKFL